jgi:hypothetical protein
MICPLPVASVATAAWMDRPLLLYCVTRPRPPETRAATEPLTPDEGAAVQQQAGQKLLSAERIERVVELRVAVADADGWSQEFFLAPWLPG